MLEKLSLSESQLRSYDNRKEEISAELNKIKDILRNQDSLKRKIEDNLNYRKTKAEVDKLTQEIESLEDRKLKIGGVSTFEAELVRHSQERERLLSEVYMEIEKLFHAHVLMLTLAVFHFIHASFLTCSHKIQVNLLLEMVAQ